MRGATLANAGAFAAALLLTGLAARGPAPPPAPAAGPTGAPASVTRVPLPGGGVGLRDATGHVVPLRPYRRIASTTTLGDRLLVELAEPDRVIAFSAAGARSPALGHRLAGRETVEGLGGLEPLLALKPDLVLTASFGASGRIQRLRDAGVAVFDLGELRGLSGVRAAAEAVGELLGAPERGQGFAATFERRLRSVAAGLEVRRRRALYVAVIGPRLFGGTAGTSYHDVLTAAGLIDAAAERFRDWPAYSAEQLIALAPELLVTKRGMGEALCAYPGLERLEACRTPGRVIELDPGLIDDPGPGMLEAAEALHARVYGQP